MKPTLSRPRGALATRRWYFVLGGIAVALVVVLLLGLVAARTLAPGERDYTADFRSSGALRKGDEVRIAGIRVGEVQSVRLTGDHVTVGFSVRDDVHVGVDSTTEVKLLTPIGGHYVDLVSNGGAGLGSTHIPPEHTRTPYEVSDLLEDVTPIIGDLDGKALRSTVTEINKSVQSSPGSIRRIIDNLTDITDVLAKRSDQIESALEVSDEYVGAIASDRVVLVDLVRQLGTVSKKLGDKKADVIHAFSVLGRFFRVLNRPIVAYAQGIEPSVTQVEAIFNKLVQDRDRLDEAITAVQEFIRRIGPLVGKDNAITIDQSASTITDADLCVPYPGKSC